MFNRIKGLTLLAAIILVTAGCASMGDNQMQTTIYDMHKRIVKLDKDLGDSITKLNETAATLNARVEEMDQQTRGLKTGIEDSTAKLNDLSKEFNRFKSDYYRLNGLTPGQATSTPGSTQNVATGPVTVTPPAGATPPPETPSKTPQGPNELEGSSAPPTGNLPPLQTPAPTAAQPAATPAASATDAGVLYQQAQKSYSGNDYATALKQFDEYLNAYPNSDNSANAQFWKAKSLLNMEKYADAIQAFETMRSKYSTSSKVPFAMHNQAVAHSRLGQTAEAERLMKAVIEQYPTSPVAEQAKADLKRLQGKQ